MEKYFHNETKFLTYYSLFYINARVFVVLNLGYTFYNSILVIKKIFDKQFMLFLIRKDPKKKFKNQLKNKVTSYFLSKLIS